MWWAIGFGAAGPVLLTLVAMVGVLFFVVMVSLMIGAVSDSGTAGWDGLPGMGLVGFGVLLVVGGLALVGALLFVTLNVGVLALLRLHQPLRCAAPPLQGLAAAGVSYVVAFAGFVLLNIVGSLTG